MSETIVASCRSIISAYENGLLGDYAPAESIAPAFPSDEAQLVYYTLPMSLNYRRPSHQLWAAAKATFLDPETYNVFDVASVENTDENELRTLLVKHRLAMQPQRHILNWSTIASTVHQEWGSVGGLLEAADYDFLQLKQTVQKTHKRSFPYLSGPKLFNFWCFTLVNYCDVDLHNKEYIDIAVDSHIRRGSAVLGLVSAEEASSLPAEHIAKRWRTALAGSDIAPTDLVVPLWYWSRDKFNFKQDIQFVLNIPAND